MLSHSRPEHLRIPQPKKKVSESASTSEADSRISADTQPLPAPSAAITDATDVTEVTDSTPESKTESDATGSALEAWGGRAMASAQTAPARVRERDNSPHQKPATKKRVSAKKASASVTETAQLQINKPQNPRQQSHSEAHRETRILVIENDIEAADHVIQILEADGYAVEIATDPTYGAMLAKTFLPHLILLGALSEQLSGADFMRSLRNTEGFAERSQVTPVLYLIDNTHLIQQRFHGLRDTPLTSTIFKPANQRELLQKVERALWPHQDFSDDIS